MKFIDRLKHAWNVFSDSNDLQNQYYGYSSFSRPDRTILQLTNERTIISSIYTRISIDASAIDIIHCRLDQNGRFAEEIKDSLYDCLTVEANKDQTARAFIQDVVMSLCDEGCVAIVPVDTTSDPKKPGVYKINSLRVGKILEWFPDYVRVKLYNDRSGEKEEIVLPKKIVAIIENPLYSVMNEPNSTLKRLVSKLSLMDSIDTRNGANKLDLIIQLPYVVRSEARKDQAERRRKDIESQLSQSKYGIAYTDGTERITQLNRPVENNLMSQIEYLTKMLYNQLGMSEKIIDGTADEQETLNYYSRTIEPILSAIVDEMKRKFLTKTARSQGQSIIFMRNPFKLVPVQELASIADTFTRNAILSSNEIRATIGYKPVNDAAADELSNKNINSNTDQDNPTTREEENTNIGDILDE